MNEQTVISPKGSFRPDVVFRDVRDSLGVRITILSVPYNGTCEDAIQKARLITDYMSQNYWDASNIESQIGATDASGFPKYVIAPNFNTIAEVSTDRARYIWGDMDCKPDRLFNNRIIED